MPVKFVNFLKSRLIFSIILLFLNVCKQTFHILHVRISQKRCFNVKYLTYYFHTKILADFQIFNASFNADITTNDIKRAVIFILFFKWINISYCLPIYNNSPGDVFHAAACSECAFSCVQDFTWKNSQFIRWSWQRIKNIQIMQSTFW